MDTVASNYRAVSDRVARAAERSGRPADSVRLVVVTKGQPAERVRAVIAAGAREIGESYIQEVEGKWPELDPELPVARHLIGHLQRNKAARAAALFDMVQSIDSAALAQALGRRAVSLGRELEVLVEVNISGEATKHGAPPDASLELVEEVAQVPGVRLVGFMGIGPADADDITTARSFARLAALFGELPTQHRQVLSMGMTADYELAIAEGATMVRVGSAIFGPRPPRQSG